MAATPPQTCPDCDCDDSLLSNVANILGIVTFVLGLAAYFVAFAAVTRGAARDVEDTRNALLMIQRQIAQADWFLKTLHYRGDSDLEMMKGLITDSLESFRGAEAKMREILAKFEPDDEEGSGRELPGLSFEPAGEEGSGHELPSMSFEADREEGPGRELPSMSFLSRLKWWYYENNVDASVAKMREFQQQYAAVQLTFLER